MDWMLTDEETLNAERRALEDCDLSDHDAVLRDPHKAIAQAQAKKLVECIEKRAFGRTLFFTPVLSITKKDWQELRRQVGLE